MGLFNYVYTIFTTNDQGYAKIKLKDDLVNLRMTCEQNSKIGISEAQIVTIMERLFEVEKKLIEKGFVDMIFNLDSIFLAKNGKLVVTILDMQNMANLKKSTEISSDK